MKKILNLTFFFFSSDCLLVFEIGMFLWKIEFAWKYHGISYIEVEEMQI